MRVMRRQLFIVFLPAWLLGMIFVSCRETSDQQPLPVDSFDKAGMIANITDNIILPSYAAMQASADSLQLACKAFAAAPDAAGLALLREHLRNTWMRYQHIGMFEMGPAENQLLRASLNTFPCDTTEINGKIAMGNFSLATAADLDAKGFPALDYLLNGRSGDALKRFTTSASSSDALKYLSVVVGEIVYKVNQTADAWHPSKGNYASGFKSNTGSSVGSSIGMLVNQLNYDFELMKNAKLGIPLGKKTMGNALPSKTEAYYGGYSLRLLREQLAVLGDLYSGTSNGINGKGFDDYVEALAAKHPQGPLHEVIRSRFAAAAGKSTLLNDPLSNSITANPAGADALYAELQQLIVLLKVDMTSALGVMITYQDNDGD